MKTKVFLFLLLLFGTTVSAQYTSIPDLNFEAKLISLKIDDILDGKVLTSKINTITELDISYSDIDDLTGIQDFVALKTLSINSNKLKIIDVSKNTALTGLSCVSNQLTNLDLTNNTALQYLYCYYNRISSLDLSKNTALASLNCSRNPIESLDLSKNIALSSLDCSGSLLTYLNIKNGNNKSIYKYNLSLLGNRTLSCIVVDDASYANTNWSASKDQNAFYSDYECSSVTAITNTLFEDKLIALGIDTDGKNGYVLNSSISTVTTLDLSNSSLTDLKGLEGFTALTTLNCSNNSLNSIDVSKNSALTTLDCSSNANLTCIQVADIALAKSNLKTIPEDAINKVSLDCGIYTLIPDSKFEAKLIALKYDNIADGKVLTSNISAITSLSIGYSSITDLTGIQDFVSLKYLSCSSNKLTSLDVSKNSALVELNCYSNKLTNLDISQNTALTNLNCYQNQLTNLDLSKNIALNYVSLTNNQLTNLDISNNPKVTSLTCDSNKLKTLNLKNGQNTVLTNLSFSDNIDLSCIIVDDVTYANSQWISQAGANIVFSPYDCSLTTSIPNALFEDKLIALGIDTDGKNGVVLNSSISALTALNLSNSALTDLKGLEGFTNLETLNVSNNLLNSLDISRNNVLTTLDCSNNENLSCIQVSDIALAKSTLKTTPAEAIDKFGLDCRGYTLIPDANFEERLVALQYDDIVDGKVITSNINKVTALEVSYNSITDFTGIQDFTALTTLDCQGNELTSIDLSKNTNLSSLNCYSNQLTTLDLSKNTNLSSLNCYSNQLTTLDLSKNTNLSTLNCYSNQLTTLDLGKNTNLTSLNCSYNQLKTLDVSTVTSLEEFIISANKINTLDVSKNTALTLLACNNNALTTLDLSQNTNLRHLNCTFNKLTILNLKNEHNRSLSPYIFNNQNLNCITVDDATYSNTNWADKKDSTAGYSNIECSLVTIIPNSLFEDKLIALGIDTDGKNGYVLNTSIETVTTLNISNTALTDAKGIEGFKALTTLDCSNNILNSLDVSKNGALTTLNCSNNTSLTCIQVADIAKTTSWIVTKDATATFNLDCKVYTLIPDTNFETKLIDLGLDDTADGKVLTNNIDKLKSLDVSGSSINDLTGIQDFVALTSFYCNYNQITSLDLSKNTYLETVSCDYNQLVSLNVSNNALINKLNCQDNKLTSLDVSNCKLLQELSCDYNEITSLDVSKNSKLNYLYCNTNKLTYLNLKNGNNTNFSFYNFSSNPNLTCIAVDDVAYSNNRWANGKDDTAYFAPYDCATITKIPNELFEDKLIALGIDTDGKNGIVLNASIETLTTLDLSNSALTDLTGLDGFKAITTLNVSNNLLSNLDLSKNSAITTLNASTNPSLTCIQVADVTAATNNWTTTKDENTNFGLDCRPFTIIPDANFEAKLIDLELDDVADGKVLTANINTLTSLNVTYSEIESLTGIEDFIALTSLSCYSNKLTSLDVSKNTALTRLDCSSNELTSLNLKNGNNTNFSYLGIYSNANLTCIAVDDVTYANANWSNKKNANAFYSNYDCSTVTQIPDGLFEDKLIALGVDTDGKNGFVLNASIETVTTLDVSSTSISNLKGIQGFIGLTSLKFSNNLLNNVDVSKNVLLTSLECSGNKLTALDITQNLALSNLACANNMMASLDVSKNLDLKTIDCSSNQLISLSLNNITKLETLNSQKNKLTAINLTNTIALTSLDLSENKLTLLNIPINTALTSLNCSSNQLASLNLKNGNNTNFNASNLHLDNNPNLSCILVDDKTYSDTNWANLKDATATYNTACELSLSSNNFTVETKGESCLGENNGEINITAIETFAYVASVNGESKNFTNNTLNLSDLTPGEYAISITIPGETFEQSFNLVIAKGTTITGKSSVLSKKVNIEITDGTAPYTVFVNGVEQFETSDSNFSVSAKGNGLLEVKTAKACEGIYSEDITDLDLVVSAYPNPTSGSFEIELPTSRKEVIIEINTLDGRVISNKKYTLENGTAKLTLENQPQGVYIATIYLDTIKNVKIIKN